MLYNILTLLLWFTLFYFIMMCLTVDENDGFRYVISVVGLVLIVIILSITKSLDSVNSYKFKKILDETFYEMVYGSDDTEHTEQ